MRLVDAETGAPVDLTADQDLITRYRQSFARWRDEVSDYCGGHAISYVPVTTTVPLEELLLHVLRNRGLLR